MKILQQSDLFTALSDRELRSLAGEVTERRFLRGEMLHTPFEKCNVITLLVSGALDIARDLPSGNRAVIRQVYPHETFGEAACQSGADYPGWIRAAADGRLLEIPYTSILGLCSSRQFLRDYLRSTGERMQLLLERVECLSYRTLRKKLACYLLHADSRQVSVTDIADYLGSSRESVSRMLTAFSREGLIDREEHGIRLLRPEAVEQLLYSM